MKKLFVLTLFFLSTTLLAQNIPSIEQVEAELEEFLAHDFFPRVGGGIGMTRMISALDTI